MPLLWGRYCRHMGAAVRKAVNTSIVTKKGDKGITNFYCSGKVLKDDICCEACGTVDELCSFLGLAKSIIEHSSTRAVINKVQKDLFVIGSEVAVNPGKENMLKERIDASYVKEIENIIHQLERKIAVQHKFIIPGGNKPSAALDVCRTIARRLERRIVTLNSKRLLHNKHILAYINRISDLLYILARLQEKSSDGR